MTTIVTRKCRATGFNVTVGHNDDLGIDDTHPWWTICDEHGASCGHETKTLAVQWSASPTWCAACQPLVIAYENRPPKLTSSQRKLVKLLPLSVLDVAKRGHQHDAIRLLKLGLADFDKNTKIVSLTERGKENS